jgi:uncharacterized protein with GYD domain
MDMHSRRELTYTVAPRYKKAKKKDKSVILHEFCKNTRYERKYAIKKLKYAWAHPDMRKKQKQIRKKVSKYIMIKASLKQCWEVSDNASATRLHAMLPALVETGIRFKELQVTSGQYELMSTISAATIGRMLKHEQRIRLRKINGQTRSGTLKYEIPFAIDTAAVTQPGTLEIDLVSHCGESAMGEFIYTLNSTDMITGWYEAEAIMGKGQHGVNKAMEEIDKRLPFSLAGIDSDNGTEFINGTLKRFADSRKITFTRSRPYQKNDNAHIEQKNYTHVRKVLGYFRFDTREQKDMMNDLYRNELRLYINYFQASEKLIKKERIGSKVKRVYDRAKTPYKRVLNCKDIPDEIKAELRMTYKQLNPFELKRIIDKKVDRIIQTILKPA